MDNFLWVAIMAYMKKILPLSFFRRKSVRIARELLGKYLVTKVRGKELALQITDVEAYDGPHDKASHASRGKTVRNKIMFAKGGVWYVYFVYGMYWLLNIVVGEQEYPAAILIRGVEGVDGPARVTRAFRVGKCHYGLSASRASNLWIEDRGTHVASSQVERVPRVGVQYAGEWAYKPLRFRIAKTKNEKRAH